MAVMTISHEPFETSEGRPFTVGDLESMPDDGRRYELVDGVLIVSPPPGLSHQQMQYALYRVLDDACPDDLHVVGAPFAVQLDDANEYQPDLLVGRFSDFTPKHLPVPPLLAVEIMSPSNRLIDMHLKKAAYAKFRIPCFWLLNPHPYDPYLTAFELDKKHDYREIAHVRGEETFLASRPFPVRIVPADLLGRLRSPDK